MQNTFTAKLNLSEPLNYDGNVYDSLFSQYERVIVESIVTSFGLDFILKDKHGGDVDTIHNVRKSEEDSQMTYKNVLNEMAYEKRGEYDPKAYHSGGLFQQTKHEARETGQATGKPIKDEYASGDIGFYGHTNSISPEKKAELDHIVECKAIQEDRGRVLSGLNGVDLANSPENFAWTNKSLNASMGSWAKSVNERYKKEHGCDAPMEMVDARAYVAAHPDMDEGTKRNLLKKYDAARKSYEAKLAIKYYTSTDFLKDTGKAAAKVGFGMGLRQVLGLVFTEMWFAVKGELQNAKHTKESLFNAIGKALKKGLENAKEKHKELLAKFMDGAIAGALSSLTTTLCNIFFTTAKNVVKIIRQSWASLVEATKIMLFNPDCLPFGERFRATAKIIATGASVVVGTCVGDMLAKTGIGAIPVVGDIAVTFCGAFVSGIMSCSLLYLLDHNSAIQSLVNVLNKIPTVDDVVMYYRRQAILLEGYCSRLMEINLDKFMKEVDLYKETMACLFEAKTQSELNVALKSVYKKLDWKSPFGVHKNCEDFMRDEEAKLVFK